MTIPVAAIAFWVLPDYPQTTRWLSPEEKKLAMYRLAAQNISAQTDATTMEMTVPQAFKAAFTDPTTYFIWFAIMMMNCSSALVREEFCTHRPSQRQPVLEISSPL